MNDTAGNRYLFGDIHGNANTHQFSHRQFQTIYIGSDNLLHRLCSPHNKPLCVPFAEITC
jgi:hypothetical protein